MNILSKEDFVNIVKTLRKDYPFDFDFLYEVYDTALNGMSDIQSMNRTSINQYEVVSYCIGEYIYTTTGMNEEQLDKFLHNDNNIFSMASIIADKYLSLSMFNYQEKKMMDRFLPPISTLNLYLNFMLNIVNTFSKNDYATKLIIDLLQKSISISRCVLSLLVDGYVTEAFASWRTLHECECTLVLLEKYGDPLIKKYYQHMTYGIAYKNGIKDKEKTDEIFAQIKSEMAEHNLKSKDMKKFIEYGWLYAIEEFNNDPSFKLNFKDGLERISGITQYGNFYNLSSEIVHATPILIYSNTQYFYYVTLLTLYEAFFRLEKSFVALLSNRVNKENFDNYLSMRKVYYSHLLELYNREKAYFISQNIKN